MNQRPPLTKELDSKTFRAYYYLKEELMDFCRAYGLPVAGGKPALTERIANYLETGEVLSVRRAPKPKRKVTVITDTSLIEPNFVCSEVHRAYFKERIGKSFTFNVAFQQWLKSHTGKTYEEAVKAYQEIRQERKTHTSTIEGQFEYNTYIREFFAHNKGYDLKDAIACWNYKKSLEGPNHYEESDLKVLKER